MATNAVWQTPSQQPAGFSPTRRACNRRACIPQLIAEAAGFWPDAVAISAGSERLTYSEMEIRSNQLAGYLRSLGVTREVPVAVCLEKPLDYLVAALAVWKAGGAYIPLDPEWPADLREWIIGDARARVLVARGAFASRSRFLVDLDLDAVMISREDQSFQLPIIKRERLACVLYDSGPAQPLGIELTHGNLLNLAFWHRKTFGVTWADRASHVANFATPESLLELWPALAAGAEVVVHAAGAPLLDFLVEHRITTAFLPSTLAEPLLSAEWPARTELRVLLTGGNSRPSNSSLPFRVVNTYGSPMCTMIAAYGDIPASHDSAEPPVMGAPIANVQIHILDSNRDPVWPGDAGEIYIGGSCVARGYLNRPDLNRDRIIPDPFSPVQDARLYRTGEFGRLLPDGRIRLLGRV